MEWNPPVLLVSRKAANAATEAAVTIITEAYEDQRRDHVRHLIREVTMAFLVGILLVLWMKKASGLYPPS